uniref:Phosphate transporter n=1 Tax=Steinernema glaseri TaxID=37863 RepID=A0A1I8A2B5_9BILA
MDTTTLGSILSTAMSAENFQHMSNNFESSLLWALIVGAILAFILGFGMGANDVSNSFGTSVGSGVLSLRNAFLLACIFETLGAVLVGFNVTDTMRKGVVEVELYKDDPKTLELGQLAILGGCGSWLLIATALSLPVSTTHSLVGATLGMSLVARGFKGIVWMKILSIVISWFASPIFSGTISIILYLIVDHTVLRRKNSFWKGLRLLPVIYFVCISFNAFVVCFQGSKLLSLSEIPLWMAVVIALSCGLIAALGFHFIARPYLIDWVNNREPEKIGQFSPSLMIPATDIKNQNGISVITISDDLPAKGKKKEKEDIGCGSRRLARSILPDSGRKDDEKTLRLFSAIQVFTACFAGFAHGANDVSNAIAPIAALYSIYQTKDVLQQNDTPIWTLLFGALAICAGLCICGHRVIQTVGQKMSKITPASGFCIEFGAAVTVLLASKVGIPVSTTHCLVGSVVAVGAVKPGDTVNWSLFRNIALSWVVTLPISGLIAAGIMGLITILA